MTILMIVLRRRPFHDLIAGTDVAYELEHGVTSVSAKRGWSKAAKIAGASLSAATIVAVVALVWAWTGAHPHDLSAREQQAYIQDNRGILDSLPQLPGSERLDLRSNPYCTNGAIVGVATTAQYRTPPRMLNQDVVDFYVRTIDDDWRHAVFNGSFQLGDGPDSPTSIDVTNARFIRGSASIFVATGYPASAYTVVVDSHHTGFSCHED